LTFFSFLLFFGGTGIHACKAGALYSLSKTPVPGFSFLNNYGKKEYMTKDHVWSAKPKKILISWSCIPVTN
jgi:hypothetical protein